MNINYELENSIRLNLTRKQWLNLISSIPIIDGLVLEFGVWKGESIRILSENISDRKVYGFDSFEGLPEDWGFNLRVLAGHFKSEEPENLPSNVVIVKGRFEETLNDFLKDKEEKISFVHIDCDLYSSTKYVLDNIKYNLQKGSILVFDEIFDYYGLTEEHELKALQDFIDENSIRLKCICTNKDKGRESGKVLFKVI